MGACYASGRGVAKDDGEAVKWFRKAADQNDAKAQYMLGLSYAIGEGVVKDDVEATKWFHKAADQSVAAAQFMLGGCYHRGEGVAKDDVEAAKSVTVKLPIKMKPTLKTCWVSFTPWAEAWRRIRSRR